MERQREQGREHWKGSGESGVADSYKNLHRDGMRTTFTGYNSLTGDGVILAILREGKVVTQAVAGDRVDIITDQTPFYGESGGQAGDSGSLSAAEASVTILDTSRPFSDLVVHHTEVREGSLAVGDTVTLQVAVDERKDTARNHTATHLLQAALRQVLGEHVNQAGSLVEPGRLRFDFTHFTAMTSDEIRQVEELVNGWIMENDQVSCAEMGMQEAIDQGATALFDEKYGDAVRVVSVGSISMELCGGTHVGASGDIGLFKVLSEAGIAAGVRRIEAATGRNALALVRRYEDDRRALATLMKADGDQTVDRVEKLLVRQRELQREVEILQAKINAAQSGDLLSQRTQVGDVTLLAVQVAVPDTKGLRDMADQLRDRIGSGVLVLGAELDGKAALLVAVTPDLTARFKAGDLVGKLAPIVGGRGGGKPELAQAGGSDPGNIPAALAAAAACLV